MRNAFALDKLSKSGLIFSVVIGQLLFIGFAAPASDDNLDDVDDAFLRDKIESIKSKILEGLGYSRPPVLTNMTRSLEERGRLIEEYKKYVADRRAEVGRLYGAGDQDEEEQEEASTVSNTLHTLTFTGRLTSCCANCVCFCTGHFVMVP